MAEMVAQPQWHFHGTPGGTPLAHWNLNGAEFRSVPGEIWQQHRGSDEAQAESPGGYPLVN